MTVKPVKPLVPTNQNLDTSEGLPGSKRKSDTYVTGSTPAEIGTKTKKYANNSSPSPSEPTLSPRAKANRLHAWSLAYQASLPQLTQDEYLAKAFSKDKSLAERNEAFNLAMICPD